MPSATGQRKPRKPKLKVLPYTSDGSHRYHCPDGEVYVTNRDAKPLSVERALWLLEKAKAALLNGDFFANDS